MTLMDAQAPKPANKTLRYVLAVLIPVIILGALLFIEFHNYSEERVVTQFLTTLQEGHYQEAYRLWKPSASYTYEDFLRGWGEHGDYGAIREFQILGSESRGSNTVIVTVRINNVDPPLDLAVDRNTKGLAYSPF
jgi:hypothetical protein